MCHSVSRRANDRARWLYPDSPKKPRCAVSRQSPSTTARSISNRASIRRTTSKFPNFWSLTSFATCARRSCCRIQQTPGGGRHCRARLAGKPRPRTTAGRQTTRRRFASRFPAWPLLLRRLGWHEPHVGYGDGFADRLSVSHVVLLPFDVRLQVSWRHQSDGMAERIELTRPMVRRGASLDANQAWWQLLEERQDSAPLQLAADEHLARSINAVHLEDRLGDDETDCRNRLHG